MTRSQQLHKEMLVCILKEQGFKGSTVKVVHLLIWIRNNCPWYPETGTYELSDWQKVGECLQTKQLLSHAVSPDLIVTW